MIKLTRPLVFFDLETTGLDVAKDRIVSISVVKYYPDGNIEEKSSLINPLIPIPKGASDIHGITDETVKDKPTFKQISKSLLSYFVGSDIAGFNNNNFDNAILSEEFCRCDIEFPEKDTKSVDACVIFKKHERRDLTAAYKFYCGEELVDAHNSLADTKATAKIFFEQIKTYEDLSGKSINEIAEMYSDGRVDIGAKIVIDKDGDYMWNFGKAKNTKIKNNLGFGTWLLENDFPKTLKNIVKRILSELKN